MLGLFEESRIKGEIEGALQRKESSNSGSKDELIERIIGHYDFFELFDPLNILDILSWDELLYISTLIDGENSERKYLPIQNIRALRNFEERSDVVFIICGYVYSCGGRSEKLNKTIAVNVSNHEIIYIY